MTTRIVFYLARADNGVIGHNGTLPWRLPADLQRFKSLTMGKPMLMGRATFDSLRKVLPGRRHLVLTRNPSWRRPGAEAVSTVDAAMAAAGKVAELAVVGGAEVYRLVLPYADRIELTEIHLSPPGDTVMPAFGPEWREVAREDHPAEGERPAHSFVTLVRG